MEGAVVTDAVRSAADFVEKVITTIQDDVFIQSRTYDADQLSARLTGAVREVGVDYIATLAPVEVEEEGVLGAVKIKGAKVPKRGRPAKAKLSDL